MRTVNPFRGNTLLVLVGVLLLSSLAMTEHRWGILTAFPRPLPVTHTAAVFPRFFTTNETLDLPYLPMDMEEANVTSYNLDLSGSLCFQFWSGSASEDYSCVTFSPQAAAWVDQPELTWTQKLDQWLRQTLLSTQSPSTEAAPFANATIIFGAMPLRHLNRNLTIPSQPKWMPRCSTPYSSKLLKPWTSCQSPMVMWARRGQYTFSPAMGTWRNNSYSGLNYTYQNPVQSIFVNPWHQWLLCGINGSCTDLQPFSMLRGGKIMLANVTWNFTEPFETSLNVTKEFRTESFVSTPVCVIPPFLFLLFKSTGQPVSSLNCSEKWCKLAQCWNATDDWDGAVVMHIPRWLPWPVDTPTALTLYRQKRDFGITAALIAAITVALAASATAAVALSTTVQTATALNNISAATAQALQNQAHINSHLKGGLMVLNQRVDLVQDQVDTLWEVAQLGCQWRLPGLCVTSVPFVNGSHAANLSRQLSSYLLGNWTKEFDELQQDLRIAIVQINSTRVDPSIAHSMTDWIKTAAASIKEWAGVGVLLSLLCGGLVLALFCLYRIRQRAAQDRVIIRQALLALQEGASPQAWLTMLNNE